MKNTSISLILKQENWTPVHNPLTMFEKCFYDDSKETFETISNKDYKNMQVNLQKLS